MLGLYPACNLYVSTKKLRRKKNGYKFRIWQNFGWRRINTADTWLGSLRRLGVGHHRGNIVLRGVKELANYYQDNEIYKNALTGVKFYIIALIAAAVAAASIVIGVGSATGFTFKQLCINRRLCSWLNSILLLD